MFANFVDLLKELAFSFVNSIVFLLCIPLIFTVIFIISFVCVCVCVCVCVGEREELVVAQMSEILTALTEL